MKLWLPTLLALIFSTNPAHSTPISAGAGDVELTAVGSALLTSENFKSTTSHGPWLVEFFSPYCAHCRNFAPTWDEVSKYVSEKTKAGSGVTAGIRMAQVNCITYGDLCSDQKIRGYPSMKLYIDGEFKEEFKGDRTFERIVDFISPYAPPPAKQEPEPETPTLKVQQVRSSHAVNPDGVVLSLNPASFAKTIGSGPVFVKFFAPWCGFCKKLAPIWTKLAQNLQNKLTIAEVNCDMYQSLCSEQGVEGYPMLYFYRDGHKLDYTGERALEAMESFSEQVMSPAVSALSLSHTDLTDLAKEHEVVFLFLHIVPDKESLSVVQDAGNTVLANPPVHIYTSSSPELRSKYGKLTRGPTMVALKVDLSGKDLIPTSFLPIVKDISRHQIHDFLARNAIPLVTELTSSNFQTVMTARVFDPKPLVVLMATKPEKRDEARRMLLAGEEHWRKEREEEREHEHGPMRDVLWVYMDGEKWGSWLKSMYGIKSGRMPTYVVADHSKLIYYDHYKSGKHFDNSAKGLSKAVEQALEGKLSKKHSQNIAQRIATVVTSYSENVVETFVAHPIYMMLAIVVAIAVIAWVVSDVLASDVGSGAGSRSKSSGMRLRLGEKHDRRLD